MQRVETRYILKDSDLFKTQVLAWSQQYDSVIWLDSNQHHEKYAQYEAVLAVGAHTFLKTDYKNAFEKLKNYQSQTKDYIFGYLGYDLKNDIENLQSNNVDSLEFEDLYFFQPKKLIFISGHTATFKYLESEKKDLKTDFECICNTENLNDKYNNSKANLKLRISKDTYLEKVHNILQNIHHGDLYEATFCQEFYSENTSIDPLKVYHNLNEISKPPFATFFKSDHQYLLSASPERY
ncbi:MAG: chorismate-binding protein, partial [Flavicella sp.]|nr:chorismate-binding protein [Flavicella sp.]